MNAPLIHRQHERRDVAADGFRSLGDFLCAVKRAADGVADNRLTRAPSGASEGDPAAGGFTVPQAYAEPVIGSIYEEATIAPLCDLTELAGPFAAIKQPAFDETSRQDGSRWGGTLGYWLPEADTIPPSAPKFRTLDFSPKKLIVLCYTTSDLFQDVNLLSDHFERAMRSEGAFKLDAAVLSGTGTGVPLGIRNAPCTITVPKEAGQVAGTFVAENIRKMWKRLPVTSRKRAVWLVNEDAEDQLESQQPELYMPAGRGGNPYPLLKGRPVLAIEQALPMGSVGDIVLADLLQYRIVQAPPRFALSADVAFLTDELAFRLVLRMDGMPAYASAVTPFNGSNITRSPFVTLDARS